MNPYDIYQAGLQGAEQGKQRGLAGLIGKAYADPSQRQKLLGMAAQTDPGAAFNAQKHFDSLDEGARQSLGQDLAVFDALPDEQKAVAYPQLAQKAKSIGIPVADQWDPAFAPNIQRLAQALGTNGAGNTVQSRFVDQQGNVLALMRDGTVQRLGVQAENRLQMRDQPGLPLGAFDPRAGTIRGVPEVGSQPAQMAPSEVPFSIDPSLPPQVQAAIRSDESSFAQAPTGATLRVPGQIPSGVAASRPAVSPEENARLAFEAERLRLAQAAEGRDQRREEREAQLGGMSPAQAFKMQQARKKETAMLRTNDAKLDSTINLIDEILARKSDFGGVTGMGAMGARIPGTDWADLANKLETLKARSAFGSLQEMRANSPTGGALGSVTERELALLQNAETQLGNSQSPPALEQSLIQYRKALQDSKRRMREGFEEFYSDSPTAQQSAPQQGGGWSIQRVP